MTEEVSPIVIPAMSNQGMNGTRNRGRVVLGTAWPPGGKASSEDPEKVRINGKENVRGGPTRSGW